jgi:hypothetical protein
MEFTQFINDVKSLDKEYVSSLFESFGDQRRMVQHVMSDNNLSTYVNMLSDDNVELTEENYKFLNISHIDSVLGEASECSTVHCCGICLENTSGQIRRLTKCDHIFHKDCIDKWFLINSKCPICRKDYL